MREESTFRDGLRFEIGLIEVKCPLRIEGRPCAKLVLIGVKKTGRHGENCWQRTSGRSRDEGKRQRLDSIHKYNIAELDKLISFYCYLLRTEN